MLRLIYRFYKVFLFFMRPLRLGVRVMMVRGGEVLLVRQTYMDGWFMPGGGVKKGETLEQAARREALEEVGAELKNISLMGAYSNFTEWKSDHNIVFFSDDFTFSKGHDREVAEVRFFPLGALPPDVWPGNRRRLEEYRAHLNDPEHAPGVSQFGEW